MAHPRPADPADEAQAVSDEFKRTTLEAEHLRLGAKMAPFAGWQMPIEYEGALAEHRAVRSHVGLFGTSPFHPPKPWVSRSHSSIRYKPYSSHRSYHRGSSG